MPINGLWRIEGAKFSPLDIGDADAHGLLERSQTSRVLGFTTLDHAQAFSKNLAGILVTAGCHELLDERRLVIG